MMDNLLHVLQDQEDMEKVDVMVKEADDSLCRPLKETEER